MISLVDITQPIGQCIDLIYRIWSFIFTTYAGIHIAGFSVLDLLLTLIVIDIIIVLLFYKVKTVRHY